MGLKESGLRGSLRNVSVGIDAIPDAVVDNFEDAPDGPYGSEETIADYYSGDVAAYVRSTSDVVEGSRALAYDGGASANVIQSAPGDGLPQYPDAGDSLRVFLRAPNFTSFAFGIEPDSGPAGYIALLADGDMRIRRFDDPDSPTDLTTSSPSITGTDWYWAEIGTPSSADPSITFDLYELNTTDLSRGSSVDSLSTSDSNYIGEAIGARTGTGDLSHTAIDDIRVL